MKASETVTLFTSRTNTGHVSDTVQADSPQLSAEEIRNVEDFCSHPEDHKVGTLKELLEDLRSALEKTLA